MQQYPGIKDEHPDTQVDYRKGAFYVQLLADAEKAMRLSQVTQSRRGQSAGRIMSFAEVSFRWVESNLSIGCKPDEPMRSRAQTGELRPRGPGRARHCACHCTRHHYQSRTAVAVAHVMQVRVCNKLSQSKALVLGRAIGAFHARLARRWASCAACLKKMRCSLPAELTPHGQSLKWSSIKQRLQ